jgi:hypothetical protein
MCFGLWCCLLVQSTGAHTSTTSAGGTPRIIWDYAAQACIVRLGKMVKPGAIALAVQAVTSSQPAAAERPEVKSKGAASTPKELNVLFHSVQAHPQFRELVMAASTACGTASKAISAANPQAFLEAVLQALSKKQTRKLRARGGVLCQKITKFSLESCAATTTAQGGHVYALGGSTLCAMIATNQAEVQLGIKWLGETLTKDDNWVALDTEHASNRLSVVQVSTLLCSWVQRKKYGAYADVDGCVCMVT